MANPQPLPFCDDWACPAKASCARHFGRSINYWRFDVEADHREGVRFAKGPREAGHDHCKDYERDEIRPWMVDAFTASPLPEGRWRMPLFVSPFETNAVREPEREVPA